MTANPSRDLLFGLFALQNGLIDQVQLVAAFQAWTRVKGRALADHLIDRDDLDADQRGVIEAMVGLHVKKHGGNAEKSLASFPAGHSTRERLAALGDPELTGTVAHLGSGSTEPDSDRTVSYAVGTATSDGQRFRILRPHARGGLGAVFVALDGELHREVAVKQILDHHADDSVSRQRFLIEAEITGGLEHPGIVPVYGLGTYDGGRPYYAMRFIKGESLKEAIEHFHTDESLKDSPGRRSLELRQLLRRFTDVCNAIDYAHSRGVLHRDIKPGNIIVGKHGETLVVDWGLAKPLGRVNPGNDTDERMLVPSSASGSAETLPGSALGTPAYMSPEQARGELDRLGPPTDVYSLGATLYCLLIGKLPIEGDDIGEVLRKVQQGHFVPPRAINPAIDPALESICLKAMALEPEDRYGACRALADDLERWMADEPVSAWREPWSRRARRWARRNRTAVTSLAAAVLVALVGTAVVLAVQTQANGRLHQANNELALANVREKQRFGLANEAIKLFHGEVGDDLVLKADQFKPLRDKLLGGALDFYSKLEELLKDQPDRGSRGAMGDAYFELGELTSKVGDKPAALAAHRKGLAIRRELALEPAADTGGNVAKSLFASATLLAETGNSAEALARLEEARDLLEGLPFSDPGSEGRRALLGTVYRRIGLVFADTGKPAMAMAAYQHSLETLTRLVEDNSAVSDFRSRLADSNNSIGLLQWYTSKPGDALEWLRRALAIRQKLADDNPAVSDFRSRVADSHLTIGAVQGGTGKAAEAMQSYGQALATLQKLADDNPAVTDFRSKLALTHNNIGWLHSQIGKPVEALESYRRTMVIQHRLADDNPSVTEFRSRLADSQSNIGWFLVMNGRAAEAVAEFSGEEAIRTRLVREDPSVPDHREKLANCQTNTATALLRLGRPSEARALCERAMGLREPLVKEHPETPIYLLGLGESLLRAGLARRDEGDATGAAADWRRADALLERSGALRPDFTFLHACCHSALSWTAGQSGSGVSAGAAEAEAVKALALLRLAAATGTSDPATYRNETALDPLRGRPDFRLLVMDLDMPADPFAR